jgi:hypothetical protein
MKKADFDLGAAGTPAASSCDLQHAEQVMKKHKHILQRAGVVGIWIGARKASPYIMVAINPDGAEELKRKIPDLLEGVSVYYIEGIPWLKA